MKIQIATLQENAHVCSIHCFPCTEGCPDFKTPTNAALKFGSIEV